MCQTLHDVFQKALIVEEDLISVGQSRTHSRVGSYQRDRCYLVHCNIRHHIGIHQEFEALGEDAHELHHDDRCLSIRLLIEDHNNSRNNDRNNNSLGLFSRTYQGSKLVGR